MFLLLLLSSCNKNDDIYNVNKKLSNMNSYTANVEVTIYGNKGNTEYKLKQYYSEPNKLRIETIEPDFIRGKIMVWDGASWKIHHPLIDSTLEVQKLKDVDELIHLGILQKSMLLWEKAEFKEINKNGAEYIQVKCNLPHGDEYRRSAVLYITKSGYCPEYMEILDDGSNVRVLVKYFDFEYNCELKDSLFKLN
jgi:outer membrane lipoprotein-sorting protein